MGNDRQSGFDDAEDRKLVRETAANLLAQNGRAVISELRERARFAFQNGDELSADAWNDIANAVERLIQINEN
jgi:hypothetical protein